MKENPFSDLTALALRHEIVSTARFLPLRCFFSDDGISYVPPHFHEDLELIHLLSGELSVTVNQKEIHDLSRRHGTFQHKYHSFHTFRACRHHGPCAFAPL